MTSSPSSLPPVECTPWCADGTGHPDAGEPAEQYCHGAAQWIDLAPTPRHLSGRPGGHLLLQLYRDVYSENGRSGPMALEPPHIEASSSGTEVLALSISEARALGGLLIQLADVATAGEPPR